MDKNMEIAQRMRGIREIKEMTASQVAEKIGIPLGEYEEYEAGQKELHVSVMYDFLRFNGYRSDGADYRKIPEIKPVYHRAQRPWRWDGSKQSL